MLEFFQNLDLPTLLDSYGYIAIVIITFLEGETIVILAGIAATHGLLNPQLVALCAFCGSVTSDQLMFSLGKYRGATMLRILPGLQRKISRASRLMRRYDTVFILGFRFVYGVRNVTPIMLGISRVRHLKFLILNLAGAAIWAVCFTAGGYYLGHAFTLFAGNIGYVLIAVLLILIILVFGIRYIRRRQKTGDDKGQCEQ